MINNENVFFRVCEKLNVLGVYIDNLIVLKDEGVVTEIGLEAEDWIWEDLLILLVGCNDEFMLDNLRCMCELARDHLDGILTNWDEENLQEFIENPEKFV